MRLALTRASWIGVGIVAIGGLAVAVLVATAGGLDRGRSVKSDDGVTEGVAQSATARAEAQAEPAVGVEQRYQLTFGTSARAAPDTVLLALEVSGLLAWTPLTEGPSRVVRGEFTASSVDLGSAGSDAARSELAAALQQPFYLLHGADGVLREVRVAKGSLPMVAELWKSIGASLQVSPRGGDASGWTATETDATGTYETAYRPIPSSGEGERRIEKRKQRYLVARDGAAAPIVTESLAELVLDGKGLVRATSREALRVHRSPFPEIQSRTTIRIIRESSRDRAGEVAGWLAAIPPPAPSPAEDLAVTTPEADRARVGDWRYGDMLAALAEELSKRKAGTASEQDKRKANRAYSALCAMLRLEPDRLGDVRERIVAGGPLTKTLVAALRDSGTREAQGVLRDLLDERSLPVEARVAVARALSLVTAPVAETVDALRGLQSDPRLGVQATYGLGAAVANLGPRDPELAHEVLSDLLRQLAAAESPVKRVEILRALGNAGHPDAIPVLEAELRSPLEGLRAAAVTGLRRIEGESADALIASAARDASGAVRASAIDAMSNRAPTAVLTSALASLVVSEPMFGVRASSVQLGARWLAGGDAALASALGVVAQRDANADLRRIAQVALERSATRRSAGAGSTR